MQPNTAQSLTQLPLNHKEHDKRIIIAHGVKYRRASTISFINDQIVLYNTYTNNELNAITLMSTILSLITNI